MTTTRQYDDLIRQLQGELPELEKSVLRVLSEHPKGLTRRLLVFEIYGYLPAGNLNNDGGDRKIRKAIESLRSKFIPIISSSGEAGYKLDASARAIQAMIAEWQSRVKNLSARIAAARKFYQLDDLPNLDLANAQTARRECFVQEALL